MLTSLAMLKRGGSSANSSNGSSDNSSSRWHSTCMVLRVSA
jgi:hypothetical protein